MLNSFKFVIPVYNAEKFVAKCINSCKSQIHNKWEAIIINDASTDNTKEEIISTANSKFLYIENRENQQALYNVFTYIPYICQDDDDIICLLDGDDWLYDETSLTCLDRVYSSGDVWLTYGQYVLSHNGQVGCCRPMDAKTYRNSGSWCTSHLKTVKYKVWKQMKPEKLMENGKFVESAAWDHAIMFSLIELAGNEHIRCVNDITYVYNTGNPISEDKKDVRKQSSLAVTTRRIVSY